MKMKKRTGNCTEDIFWECVSEMGWDGGDGWDATKRECLFAWSPEFGSSFREILEAKELEVCSRFVDFAENNLSRNERDEYYLSDDGFGDFCSHVVGLGREVFVEEMENPRKLFERARDGDYQEKFSYCIPDKGEPDLSWERWVKMHAPQGVTSEDEWKKEWEASGYGEPDEIFEDHLDKMRRQLVDYQLGDWSYLDPGHYVPLSKRYHRRCAAFVADLAGLETRTCSEQDALGFATLLMHYFYALIEGRTEEALEASEEALRAWWGLHYIDKDLGALRKFQAELLPMAGNGMYGGENSINDHRIFMGGLPKFKSRHHYKLFLESLKS